MDRSSLATACISRYLGCIRVMVVTCPYVDPVCGAVGTPSTDSLSTTSTRDRKKHQLFKPNSARTQAKMSSSTATQTRGQRLQEPVKRGTRGRGGRRGGSKASRGKNDKPSPPSNATSPEEMISVPEKPVKDTPDAPNPVAEVSDAAICWICAEPVKYYSVSACNHRTCHICALRLRALYKKLECTFCKVRSIDWLNADADFGNRNRSPRLYSLAPWMPPSPPIGQMISPTKTSSSRYTSKPST